MVLLPLIPRKCKRKKERKKRDGGHVLPYLRYVVYVCAAAFVYQQQTVVYLVAGGGWSEIIVGMKRA